MKKILFKKSLWKSLISVAILIVFIVFAVGSFELLLLGLDFVEVEEMPDGRTKSTWDTWINKSERVGYRTDGKWNGEVEDVCKTFGGVVLSKTKGYYLDGTKMGKFVTEEYNASGEVTKTITECYFFDIQEPCGKSTYIKTEDESAVDILLNKYPFFYRDLKAYYFDDTHIKSYIDSIQNIIDTSDYDVSGFDDYYDEAVDNLKTGIYDSLWIMHDRLALLYGLEELKQSQFRMAVIDHHRNPENTTFSIIQDSYPNYLDAVNDEGVGNSDFEVFCDISDSIFTTYSPLDPNNHFFPDSIDIRLYRTLDIIYSDEYTQSKSLLIKSAIRSDPGLLKSIKENLKNSGENNPFGVDPNDVAGVVGLIMQKHYNKADKIRMAVREVYLKKGGIVDSPTTVTMIGDTVSTTSININANVIVDGGAEINGRGIAWATFYNPTIDDNYIESGAGMGEFTVNMEEMEFGKTYYFRSYAINSAGVGYGNCISFVAGPTAINEIINPETDFTIYPNPATDFAIVHFRVDLPEGWILTISDMQGRIVYYKKQLSFGENSVRLNLSKFESGIYNCRLTNGENRISQKFLVSR